MIRRIVLVLFCAICIATAMSGSQAHAQKAYGLQWGSPNRNQDWERFYHYPYVYYPQNYWGADDYRSADDLYYRYPPQMRVPIYNKHWHNSYPEGRLYQSGHHFILDVF